MISLAASLAAASAVAAPQWSPPLILRLRIRPGEANRSRLAPKDPCLLAGRELFDGDGQIYLYDNPLLKMASETL